MARTKKALGFELQQTLAGHGGGSQITQAAWSPDGNSLASCGDDGTIRLWDVATGEQLRAFREHKAPVWCLAWSPDGKALASGSDDKTIRLWDPGTERSLQVLTEHSGTVATIAWSPDGGQFASGGFDGDVRLWNLSNGKCVRTLKADTGGVYGLAWSSDGTTLAVGGYSGDVRLWNARTGGMLQELQGIEGSSTYSLAGSGPGQLLAAGYWDGTIRLWDTRQGRGHPSYDLDGHQDAVESLSFSHDGRLLASKSSDDTVRLWHCRTRQVLSVLRETAAEEWVGGLAFHPKEAALATLGKEDTVIRIWKINVEALLPPSPSPLPDPGLPLLKAATSPEASAEPVPGLNRRVKVFISYSHKDAEYLDRLKIFLRAVERRRQGLLEIWDDRRIHAGDRWQIEIQEALASANVAVFLISEDFLASEFIYQVELPALLARERASGLTILPVLLKPSSFKRTELAQFQAINPGLKTLLEMSDAERELLWISVAEAIENRFS